MIKNSDWIILNSIIYKMYSTDNLSEMQSNLLAQLKELIDFDSAAFFLSSADNPHQLTKPVGYNYPEDQLNEYIRNQKRFDYSEGIVFTDKNMVYRSSDLVPEKIRTSTEYYKKIYIKNNWHYSLHLNISYNDIFLGTISFFRKKGKEDFTYDDMFVLETIKDHLALCLYRGQNNTISPLSIKECAEKYGLSRREMCVLKRLVTEKTAQEISEELVITTNTLRKHISNIYKKMGISSRIQLFDKITNQQ